MRDIKLLTNKECTFIKKNFKSVDNMICYYANYLCLEHELKSQGKEEREIFESIDDGEIVAMVFDVTEMEINGVEKIYLDVIIRGDFYHLSVTDELREIFHENQQFQFEYSEAYDYDEIETYDFLRFISYIVNIKDNTVTEMHLLPESLKNEGEAIFKKIIEYGASAVPYIYNQVKQ